MIGAVLAAALAAQQVDLEALRQKHSIPAVSVAVIEGGRIAWAKGYGGADPETLFQAASISKPVAAMAALHMMQYGNFTLDEDVNGRLKSWKVPDNGFTAKEKVTPRRLLSHSAGLTVHGFPGYAAGERVPSLQQILDGEPPSNTAAIRADVEPGTKFRYSGGGYTVLQQLLMDRTGMAFPELMQKMVLGRIGMKRSTYEQPLPAALSGKAARGHDAKGIPIAGGFHTYPEMAAAGLWTTASDLALWALELRGAYLGKANRIIERSTAREMLKRQTGPYGLGVALSTDGPLRFSHGGANAGYRCLLTLYVESGNGAVVMTNADGGMALIEEAMKLLVRTE